MSGLTIFRHKLGGWMATDGEPRCPKCWAEFLSQFPKVGKPARAEVEKDSLPLTAIVRGHEHGTNRGEKAKAAAARRNYRSPDGWCVSCEKCGISIYVPYTAGEKTN